MGPPKRGGPTDRLAERQHHLLAAAAAAVGVAAAAADLHLEATALNHYRATYSMHTLGQCKALDHKP